MPSLGITVAEAARQLGITRAMFSRILNEHASITPEMAIRLEVWLGKINGSSASIWLAHQSAYDLWLARQKWDKIKLQIRMLEITGSKLC